MTSCINLEDDVEIASTKPILAEVTTIANPTNDSTPDYTFSSTEAGTITYGGSCSSSTTSATSGNNTITLVSLSTGIYSDCTITVTDTAGNVSNTLSITSFVVLPSYVTVWSIWHNSYLIRWNLLDFQNFWYIRKS